MPIKIQIGIFVEIDTLTVKLIFKKKQKEALTLLKQKKVEYFIYHK